ncbi:MAG TPA: efflux transporter outer membrane subunit [Opitutales bacterium]|nr:efflux transporter outer membrane subunit [Opitutales bacterium]
MKPRSRLPFLQRARWAALTAGGLALAGCMTVGPDYHPPEVKTPASWLDLDKPTSDTVTSRLVASPVAAVDWWKVFGDPKLVELVKEAADQNLTVLQAEARIRASRASVGVVNAGRLPSVNASGSYSYGSSPTIIGGEPHESPPRSSFRSGLDAAWELDIFGGTQRSVEAAQANLQSVVESRRDTLLTLVAEVAVDYIDLRSEQELLSIAHQNLDDEQHTLKITQDRWQAGLASQLDYENAKAATDSTRSQIPSIEASIRTSIYSLSLLLGRTPGDLLDELSTPTDIPKTPDSIPVGLPADLLRRRPDIRAAEAQLHADTANVGVAIAQYFPQFSVSGSFGFQGVSIGQMTQWAAQSWSWGPTISWPIFASGRISAQVELQRATLQGDLFAYRNTVLTALGEVEAAQIAFTKDQERREALREVFQDNQQALKLSLQLYTEGQAEFINVLSAELSVASSQSALSQSNATVATDLVALFKALGGGWSEFPERDATMLEYGEPPPHPPTVEAPHQPGPPTMARFHY